MPKLTIDAAPVFRRCFGRRSAARAVPDELVGKLCIGFAIRYEFLLIIPRIHSVNDDDSEERCVAPEPPALEFERVLDPQAVHALTIVPVDCPSVGEVMFASLERGTTR